MQDQKTNLWRIAYRVLFTVALIACIAFIFHNSLQSGNESSERSRMIMAMVNSILAKVRLGPLSEHAIRKLAHFAEFTALGFLLMLCLRVYTRRFVRHVSWPLLAGLTIALTDETIQLLVDGRSSQVMDVWIDMGGVMAGLCTALLVLLIVHLVATVHRLRKENQRLRAGVETGKEGGTL